MPLSAPVATLTSSLSHIVPMMLGLTVVIKPARLKVSAMRLARSVMPPPSSPMCVSLPCVPTMMWPSASITPPA